MSHEIKSHGSLCFTISADHIAVNGIYIRNVILVSADAEVEIYVVFAGNLVQFLKENGVRISTSSLCRYAKRYFYNR